METIKICVGSKFIGFFRVINGEIKIPREQFNEIVKKVMKT